MTDKPSTAFLLFGYSAICAPVFLLAKDGSGTRPPGCPAPWPSEVRQQVAAPFPTEPSVPSSVLYRRVRPATIRGGALNLDGRPGGSVVEVEVPRGLLLEPEPVVLRRLLEEVGCLLQHVAVRGGRLEAACRSGPIASRCCVARRSVGRALSGSSAGSSGAVSSSARTRARAEAARAGRPRGRPGEVAGRRRSRRVGVGVHVRVGVQLLLDRIRNGLGVGLHRQRLGVPQDGLVGLDGGGSKATSRRAGPSASASCRVTSSSVAPCCFFSSRCSRIASSRMPMGAQTSAKRASVQPARPGSCRPAWRGRARRRPRR